MNKKEYLRISKLSLNSRKKSTKTTVNGLSFGLSLIMPLLFVGVAVFMSLVGVFNNNRSSLNFTAKIIDSGYVNENNSNYQPIRELLATENQQKFLNLNAKQKIVYNEINHYHRLNYVVLGNKKFGSENRWIELKSKTFSRYDKSAKKYIKEQYSLSKSVMLDYDLSQNFAGITPNKYKYSDSEIFLPGYDKGFTGDRRGQVIVSEIYLYALGVTPEDAYLKPLTINFSDNFNGYYDDDTDATNYFQTQGHRSFNLNFITEFEIVGVIKESVTKNEVVSSRENGQLNGYMDSMMFFSKNSLKNEDGGYNLPYYSSFREYDIDRDEVVSRKLATYPERLENLTEPISGKMILGAENFSIRSSYSDIDGKESSVTQTHIRVACDDFYNFYSVAKEIKTFNLNKSADNALTTIVSELSGQGVGQIFSFISLYLILMCVFGVIGLILLSSALINIFNIVAHSIHIRKNYLGVMQAIGLKKKGIIKLYMCEISVIFKEALKQIFIFGGLICAGIVFAINSAYIKIESTYFEINGLIIIPAFMFISAFLYLVGYVIVMACCGKVKNKNIPELLKNEQN